MAGKRSKIALLAGDGIGPEITEAARRVLVAASLNAGDDYAMAQAQHGSAPDIAGRDLANPTSLISSAAMLLDWLGRRRHEPKLTAAARAIETALDAVLAMPDQRTADLGGRNGTQSFTDAVISQL